MLYLVALIVWIILMIIWLFGGSYSVLNAPTPDHRIWITNSIIPWVCVLILGLFFFGAFGVPVLMVPQR